MAEKRMFSKQVTKSDAFLEMPQSTQNLYFHLSMDADDDGFINNYKGIMRLTGCKEDDLKLLIAKSFILPFETGVIVVRHWRVNNYLRKDRYTETQYLKEKTHLKIEENGEYIFDELNCGIPMVDTDKSSIDKSSIDKSSIDNKKPKQFIPPTLEEVEEYAKNRNKEELAKPFYDYYMAGDWSDVKGNKVKNWKQKFITWENNNKFNKPKQSQPKRDYGGEDDGITLLPWNNE